MSVRLLEEFFILVELCDFLIDGAILSEASAVFSIAGLPIDNDESIPLPFANNFSFKWRKRIKI